MGQPNFLNSTHPTHHTQLAQHNSTNTFIHPNKPSPTHPAHLNQLYQLISPNPTKLAYFKSIHPNQNQPNPRKPISTHLNSIKLHSNSPNQMNLTQPNHTQPNSTESDPIKLNQTQPQLRSTCQITIGNLWPFYKPPF